MLMLMYLFLFQVWLDLLDCVLVTSMRLVKFKVFTRFSAYILTTLH